MVTKIKKWGNSQGLRVAKHLLEASSISIGDDVEITAKSGVIVIKKVRTVRHKKYRLAELVKQMPKSYRVAEMDWGEPSGKEVW